MIEINSGIRIGSDIIIDPTRKHPRAFVSHAHSDHLRNHNIIHATEITIRLARSRVSKFTAVPLEYGKTYAFDSAKIRPEPAGHILGSAQFIIDWLNCRIVYTGDFKLGHNETCRPAQIHECDILFMDTTFGRGDFSFPDYQFLTQKLLEFVDACLHKSTIPVIYAYTLGKSQEVMKILGDNGFRTYVTPETYEYAQIYREHGVSIENFEIMGESYPENGAVILPPSSRHIPEVIYRARKKTCFVSGWAMSGNKFISGRFDEAIPLSDHASYEQLLEYVEVARPKKIFCLFGFQEIVDDLKRRGYDAARASLAGPKNRQNSDLFIKDLFSTS